MERIFCFAEARVLPFVLRPGASCEKCRALVAAAAARQKKQ